MGVCVDICYTVPCKLVRPRFRDSTADLWFHMWEWFRWAQVCRRSSLFFYFTCLLETNLGCCTFSYVFFLEEKKLQAIWMTWSISLVDCGIWADSQRKFLLEIRFLPSPRACHVLEEREIEKGKEGKYDSGRQRNSCVQRPKQKIICWCLTMIESHFNLNTYNFGECTSFKEENCVTFFYFKNFRYHKIERLNGLKL